MLFCCCLKLLSTRMALQNSLLRGKDKHGKISPQFQFTKGKLKISCMQYRTRTYWLCWRIDDLECIIDIGPSFFVCKMGRWSLIKCPSRYSLGSWHSGSDNSHCGSCYVHRRMPRSTPGLDSVDINRISLTVTNGVSRRCQISFGHKITLVENHWIRSVRW